VASVDLHLRYVYLFSILLFQSCKFLCGYIHLFYLYVEPMEI
jgi:hypothetical protein